MGKIVRKLKRFGEKAEKTRKAIVEGRKKLREWERRTYGEKGMPSTADLLGFEELRKEKKRRQRR